MNSTSSIYVEDFRKVGFTDAEIIRAAVTKAADSGTAKVVFGARTYTVDSTIHVPSNLEIDGNGATLKWPSSGPAHALFDLTNSRNVAIHDLTLTGTSRNVTSPLQSHALALNNSDTVLIDHVVVSTPKGISIIGGENVTISNSTFNNIIEGIVVGALSGNEVGHDAISNNIKIIDNSIFSSVREAIDLNSNASNILISHNRIGALPNGSTVSADELIDIGGGAMSHVAITSNEIDGGNDYAFGIRVKLNASDVVIANNVVENLYSLGSYGAAVRLEQTSAVQVYGNHFKGAYVGVDASASAPTVLKDNIFEKISAGDVVGAARHLDKTTDNIGPVGVPEDNIVLSETLTPPTDESLGKALVDPTVNLSTLISNAATVVGSGGNDFLDTGTGLKLLVGGGGHDVAVSHGSALGVSFTWQSDIDTLVQWENGIPSKFYQGIAEIQFLDGRMVFNNSDPSAAVSRLYQAALGRIPDENGLNYWTAQLQHEGDLRVLAGDFINSIEFQTRFVGTNPNDGFVTQMYENVLQRKPDEGGLQNWTGALGAGAISRAEVLVGFSESMENVQRTSALVENGIWDRDENAALVARLYDAALGRLPDIGGLAWHVSAIKSGSTTTAIANIFVNSSEFQDDYGNLTDQAFIQKMYDNALNRVGEQQEITNWVNYISNGHTRAEVLLAFSESQEHVNLTVNHIQPLADHGITFV